MDVSMEYPFDDWPFPGEKDHMPAHSFNAQGWVIENFSFYDTQWIKCSYPISGGYARTPRYIYYFFIFFALFGRKSAWITNASLGLVMTFSSAAAIHGLMLVIIQHNLFPDYLFDTNSWEVDGPTFVNRLTDERLYNETTNEAWLPVIPMVWDNDGDAVLAIVGVAFLALLPMQTWSTTLNNKTKEIMILITLWAFLLTGGLVSAIIYVESTLLWTYPQLRFCPLGAADKLPFNSQGSYPTEWIIEGRYHWNWIVGEHYIYKNASIRLPDICLYPCFDFKYLLRDPEDIYVTEGFSKLTKVAYRAHTGTYVIVISSWMCNLVLDLVIRNNWLTNTSWGLDHGFVMLIRKHKFFAVWKQVWNKRLPTDTFLQWIWQAVTAIFFWYVSVFAIVVSPVALLAFTGYFEWLLWTQNLGGESFRHVGQWSALIGAGLVVVSGGGPRLVMWLFSRYKRPSQLGDSRSWWRH